MYGENVPGLPGAKQNDDKACCYRVYRKRYGSKNKWPVLIRFEIERNEIWPPEDDNIICANFNAFQLLAAENVHKNFNMWIQCTSEAMALKTFQSEPIPEKQPRDDSSEIAPTYP